MARIEDGRGGRDDRAVYVISVAAELSGVHPQTLRIYERKGLLRPKRTSGNTRRYSERDIERLRSIQRLTQDQGVNLAGAKIIMELQREMERMRDEMERMRVEVGRLRKRVRDGTRERGELVLRREMRDLLGREPSWT